MIQPLNPELPESVSESTLVETEDQHIEAPAEATDQVAEGKEPAAGQKDPQHPKRTVLVRYGKVGMIGHFRHSERELPSLHTKVVIQTDRGLELGEIVSPAAAHNRYTCTIPRERIDQYIKDSGGSDYPFSRSGRVVRLATVQDLNEQRHIEQNVEKEGKHFKERAREMHLPMKLVDVEHLFGGDRIIFYFLADGRVDFRELVRELGREFNTRIEMRQVGARDEARLIGDYDTCGRELCCKAFLKVLLPVNMRMAKVQRTTLDPSKISGRCGRLKCCLRYENEGYEALEKNLPRQGQLGLSEYGVGTVRETMVLTQLVKLRLDSSGRTIAINVDELLDKRYDPKKSGPPPKPKPIPTPLGMGGGPELGEPMETNQQSGDEKKDGSSRERRNRSRRRRSGQRGSGRGNAQKNTSGDSQRAEKPASSGPSGSPGEGGQGGGSQGGSGQEGAQAAGSEGSDGQSSKRRRRRRRGGRGRGRQNPDSPGPKPSE